MSCPPPTFSDSPKRADSRGLPSSTNLNSFYYNAEVPDSQGLGVDGRKTGQESGWAEPLIPSSVNPITPVASIRPTLTRLDSGNLPSRSRNVGRHEAIPHSRAYLNFPQEPPSTTTSMAKVKNSISTVKSFLGFTNSGDLLHHMDVNLDEIIRGRTCRPLSLSE